MLESLGSIELSRVTEEEGFDFTRDWKTVQTAILNFGRDRFDIFRFVVDPIISCFLFFFFRWLITS